MNRGAFRFTGSFLSVDSCINLFLSKQICRTTLIDKNTSKLSDGYIVQGIAILANEHLEPYAGASKKRVRRAMLIGSCAPCDSVPRSKLEERSWFVWHEPLSVAIVWALKLTYIEEFFSFARVLRHFVLVPCEICVVPYRHGKIAADWNDITLANRESTVVS